MDGTVGEFLYAGVSASSGGIISFLDDDDLFSSNKLEVVYNKFKSTNNLCYYHNTHITMDKKYQKFDSKLGKSVAFNLSSISVRKSILNLNYLKKISANTDHFMYLSALDSGKNISTDNKKLTCYMRHNSSSQIETKNLDKFIEMSNKNFQIYMDSFKLFDALFISRNAKNEIKQQITQQEILGYIYGNKTKPKNALNVFCKSGTIFSSKLKYYLAYILVRIHYNSRYFLIKKMFYNAQSFNNNKSNRTLIEW